MNILKNIIKIVSLSLIMVLMVSCSSSRIINAPYSSVAKAAKERFAKNSWTKTGTIESTLEEGRDYVGIYYYEWEFPNIKIYSEIDVQPYGKGKSKVWVYVKNCDSWWYPFSFSPALATGVLDNFEKRMKWHSFGWPDMPWKKYNNVDGN